MDSFITSMFMTPCLVFHLRAVFSEPSPFLKNKICFAKITKVIDAFASQFHNFEIKHLIQQTLPLPHTLFSDFSFYAAVIFFPFRKFKVTFEWVCVAVGGWRVDFHPTQRQLTPSQPLSLSSLPHNDPSCPALLK